jgi:hypothetical protein
VDSKVRLLDEDVRPYARGKFFRSHNLAGTFGKREKNLECSAAQLDRLVVPEKQATVGV